MPKVYIPARRKKKVGDDSVGVVLGHQIPAGNIWHNDVRMEAITNYLATGNITLTSQLCGVPRDTLKTWMKSPWWYEAIEDIHNGENVELSKKSKDIIQKTLTALEDRVQNGNYVMDGKTKKIKRVPVNAKELGDIASKIIDRRQLLNKEPTRYTESTSDKMRMNEKLNQLAKAFISFTKAGGAEKQIIEGEIIPEQIQLEETLNKPSTG